MNTTAQNHWSHDIDEMETSYNAFKYLKAMAAEYGFEKFSVVEVPWEDCELSTVSIVNNWEPGFVKIYDELKLSRNSPIFLHTRKSVRPLLFDVKEIQSQKPTDQREMAIEEFESFGKTKGLILPVHTSHGMRGAITFTGNDIVISDEQIDQLQVRALYLFERIVELHQHSDRLKVPDLSKKEVECLKWAAAGKTSAETAMITELTENAVNHCMAASVKKLNASNRAHAIAKAIRLRLIS
jgi:DNA-binding CsgD family transcriptional regulator